MFNYRFKDIAFVDNGTIAISEDNKMYCVGYNSSGCFGDGEWESIIETAYKLLKNMDDVKQIACGHDYTFILKNDGSLWSCGYNYYGNLGLGDNNHRTTFTQVTTNINNDVKEVICGGSHTFIIKNDGSIWACGGNSQGQLGLGDTTDKNTFTQVTTNINNDVKQISCGRLQTLILKNNGSLWACGSNSSGALGLSSIDKAIVPTQVTTNINNDVKQVVSYDQSAMLLKNDGTVWSCGWNTYGQTGQGNTTTYKYFKKITSITNVNKLFKASLYHIFLLKNDGTVWACGNNYDGQLGLGNTTNKNTFTQVNGISDGIVDIYCDNYSTFILKNDGTVWACGYVNELIEQLGYPVTVFSQINCNDVEKCFMSNSAEFVICDGKVYSRGRNAYSQLGYITFPKRSVFTYAGINDVKNIKSQSGCDVYVINNKDELFVCGANYSGQLGLGTYDSMLEYTKIANDVKNVYPSDEHTFVVKNNGDIYFSGTSYCGESGLGKEYDEELQTLVKVNINNVNKIYQTVYSVFFVKNDGTVWACGDNSEGALGLDENVKSVYDITQLNIDDVKEIICSKDEYVGSTIIIKNDGTVWASGYNGDGRLGLGHNEDTYGFTQVDISNVKKGFMKNGSVYLLKYDNSLWVCGNNSYGQLGLGDIVERNTFVQSNVDVKDIFLYSDLTSSYAFIITNDNKLWSTGSNNSGQLGLGNTADVLTWTEIKYKIPVENINKIYCTEDCAIIILNDGRGYFSGYNQYLKSGLNLYANHTYDYICEFTPYDQDFSEVEFDVNINGEEITVIKGSFINGNEIIIDSNNILYVKGNNSNGQLGLGDNISREEFVKVEGLDNVKYCTIIKDITIVESNGDLYVAGKYIGNKFEKYDFE